MKIRTEFVTNSSSSSFVLIITFLLQNGSDIIFYARGGSPECGRCDYFSSDAVVKVSPKQLGLAKDVDELIQLLTDGVIDYGWEETEKIFEKSNPVKSDVSNQIYDAYDFIQQLRENITSMDDVTEIRITGNEYNYRNYEQSYTYNRKTGEYFGAVSGCEFEKDGSSGGALCFGVEDCEIIYCDYDEDEAW